jgi:hypothetical protein
MVARKGDLIVEWDDVDDYCATALRRGGDTPGIVARDGDSSKQRTVSAIVHLDQAPNEVGAVRQNRAYYFCYCYRYYSLHS